MLAELREQLDNVEERRHEVDNLRSIVQREKHKYAGRNSPYNVSLARQVKQALVREAERRWTDQASFWQRLGSPVIMSFVTGSLFYNIPQTTTGLFLPQGVQFLTYIYPV